MKVIKEVIDDVCHAWPLFAPAIGRAKLGLVPRVGVLELRFPFDGGALNEVELIKHGASEFQAAMLRSDLYSEGYRPYLFVCTNAWQPDNRITRYYKMWRHLAEFGDLSQFEPSDELLIEGDGIRLAAIAAISPAALTTAFKIVSAAFSYSVYCSGFVFVTRKTDQLSQSAVSALYEVAFPPNQGRRRLTYDFEIANACLFRCPEGDIVVKCGTDRHEGYFFVDAFAEPALVARLNGA